MKTRYYRFTTGSGVVKRTGAFVYYLDKDGNWIKNSDLFRMFVGGDTDYYEISEEEAEQLVKNRKNKNSIPNEGSKINGVSPTIKNSCDKCNKHFNIETNGGYLCLCDECLRLCKSNYDHELFMKSFDVFLGENKIANIERKKQPVIHDCYFFKLHSIFEDKRLKSDDAEEAVKESLDYIVEHVKAMKEREAERLKDITTYVYDAKEYAKDCTSITWADSFDEGLYKGKFYEVNIYGENVTLYSKEKINSSSRAVSSNRPRYTTNLKIKELDALFHSKLYVSLFGYLFEVLLIDDRMKEVKISDHMRREKGPCLDDRCSLTFVHDHNMGITYKDLTSDEIDKIERIVIERKTISY